MKSQSLHIFGPVRFEGRRKWSFVVQGMTLKGRKVTKDGKDITLITPCPGGFATAEKVARQIAGAIKRSREIDNLARTQIAKILTPS